SSPRPRATPRDARSTATCTSPTRATGSRAGATRRSGTRPSSASSIRTCAARTGRARRRWAQHRRRPTMASMLPGTSNARDLGGPPPAGGRSARSGALLRSDALSALTDEGLALLAGVGTVIDLRTAAEREGAPDRLPGAEALRILELPLLEGAIAQLAPEAAALQEQRAQAGPSPEMLETLRAQIPTLDGLYVSMLEHGAETFA